MLSALVLLVRSLSSLILPACTPAGDFVVVVLLSGELARLLELVRELLELIACLARAPKELANNELQRGRLLTFLA